MSSDTEAPFVVHFLGSLTVPTSNRMHASSFSATYGSELTVDDAVRAAGVGRYGRPATWLQLVDDEEQQVRLWGEVRVRRGPWPEGVDRIQEGSPAWDDRRVAALRAAAMLPDADQQRIPAARVREKYGSATEARSHTIATYGQAR